MTYLIVTIHKILDQAAFDEYARAAKPILQSYGGEYVAIDKSPEVKAGAWPFVRTIVIMFPSGERAHQWYASPEYQEIVSLRIKAIDANLVFARGLDEAPVEGYEWPNVRAA